ncbi:hypothetical protein D9Q98_002196 [Chlorella vulgaris]|uniref:Rhodanese domain-containing protein n=1 Tax=Chlorella vulgaris TaxID=3077 RepID=A0A9D4Z011_CHLVU|nr:hypothetical protein D9Q98_002196 [Chlorella vulgaris]
MVLPDGSNPTTSGASDDEVHDAKSNAVHALAKKIARHFPTVPVTNCTALRRDALDVTVVDVRQPDEVAVSMIPGSLTAAEFEARKNDLKDKTVVCYCTVGYRSSAYAAKLRSAGIEAKNLEGGIVRWSQKGLPLVTRKDGGEEQETKRIHVYGPTWALQPDDYEPVMFKSAFVATLKSFLPKWGGRKK